MSLFIPLTNVPDIFLEKRFMHYLNVLDDEYLRLALGYPIELVIFELQRVAAELRIRGYPLHVWNDVEERLKLRFATYPTTTTPPYYYQ